MAKKKQVSTQNIVPEIAPLPLKLDIGCGKNKIAPDWVGVDSIKFPGVDVQLNVAERNSGNTTGFKKWPWEDNSVDEVHSSHFVEHLEAEERIHFANELYRVLKPGCKATIIVPHWSSCRAYGDMTHKWPPVSEFWFYYLSKGWRAGDGTNGANAPHDDIEFNPKGYSCNFACTWGFTFRPDLNAKHQDVQMYAMTNYKDAIQDCVATLVKA